MSGQATTSLYILVAVIVVGIWASGLLQVVQLSIMELMQQRIFTRASFELSYRMSRFVTQATDQQHLPELANRFFDTLSIQKGLPKILLDFSSAILQIIFGLSLLAFYHPFFVFFGLTLIVVVILLFWLTAPQGLASSLKESKYKYQIGRSAQAFKLSGSSTTLPLTRTNELVNGYIDARNKHFKILKIQYYSIIAFKVLVIGSLMLLGGALVIDNEISVGQFVAADIIVITVVNSVEKLVISMETVYDVLTAAEKMGLVTDIALEPETGMDFAPVAQAHTGIAIEVRQLSYHFDNNTQPILHNISLDIKAGESLCIAGFGGSGKSVLLRTLASVYQDFEGTICYNNLPLQNINAPSLRTYIGSGAMGDDVFQGTIIENITMGAKHIDFESVAAAARTVGLEAYIKTLPKGYETPVKSAGAGLPKNILLKIILARCLAKKPKLIVLEDVFGVLEANERKHIIHYLTDPAHGFTLIIASNKPLIAARCHQTLVLQKGTVLHHAPFSQIAKQAYFNDIFKANSEI
jgi:ABC-type bacteriocin/lantibiotic exporter with double-glycine peptidase domain